MRARGGGGGRRNSSESATSRRGGLRGLVNWCFEPSQPLRIISGLKETLMKRHIVERVNKTEK